MNVFVLRKVGLFILFIMLLGLRPLSANPDSLRTRWINGKKFVIHKVLPKETWSSVSRRYHISVEELQKSNPGVDGLKIGQIINVPSVDAAVKKIENVDSKPVDATPGQVPARENTGNGQIKIHIVKKGETLFALSRMYGMTVDEIKNLNNLSSNALSLGQQIKVRQEGNKAVSRDPEKPESIVKNTHTDAQPVVDAKPVSVIVQEPDGGNSVKESKQEEKEEKEGKPKELPRQLNHDPSQVMKVDSPAASNSGATGEGLPAVYNNPGTSRTSVIEKDPKSGVEVEKITEVGVAAWLSESELNQSKFYALHRTAPVGTIIKLTNRMNNNSVFVKVVGALPDTGDNTHIIIKITQAAAQRIGALDQKFTAELSYGISR